MSKNFYITTPIYYVNDKPHIGHAYTSLAADILARFKRLDGYNVKFLTGTDEHGQKVEKSAEKIGKNPKEFVDEVSQYFKDLTPLLNLSNDDFIRTTQDRHIKAVQDLWTNLESKGYIYLDKYSGWYALRDEAYYSENELIVKEDGTKLAPTGAEVVWKEEESYFFKLSSFTDKLLNFYESNKEFISPSSRYNEVFNFVKSGLHDLAISRSNFSWGIPVPNDKNHVMYVWMDALTNYLSALGYPDTNSNDYINYWSHNEAIHLVGKDIIRFHCVYWPAFLMALDLPLPKKVFAHGWWLNEGEKISKSLGNVIVPADIVSEFGLDAIRYFLFKEVNFGNDGDFSKSSVIARNNNELANEYGNLLQRSMSILNKSFDGILDGSCLTSEQNEYLEKITNDILKDARTFIDKQDISGYIDKSWELIRYGNSYMNQSAPWKMIKDEDFESAKGVLFFIAEILRRVSLLLQPVVPNSAQKVLEQLNVSLDIDFSDFNKKFANEHKINPVYPVFNKIISEEE